MLLRMYLRWAERRGFDVELDDGHRRRRGRHLLGHVHGEGPPRLRAAARRARRAPPGAHLAVRQQREAPDQLRRGQGHAVHRGRRHRDRDRRQGPAHRHLPVVGCRRPARQRDRLRGAHHPPAHRRRDVVPERALPAPEQGPGHADPEGQAARARASEASGPARRDHRGPVLGGLRQPDPLLRDAAVPDGQGPPVGARAVEPRRRPRRRPRRVHGGLPALAAGPERRPRRIVGGRHPTPPPGVLSPVCNTATGVDLDGPDTGRLMVRTP